MTIERDILWWLAGGEVGEASKALAFCLVDIGGQTDHPWDASDFRRCVLLIRSVPGSRELLHKARTLSPEWAYFVDHWELLEQTLIAETGAHLSKYRRAPKTNAMISRILRREVLK